MNSLGGIGNGGFWFDKPRPSNSSRRSKPTDSVDSTSSGYRFPLKQACTAASLALAGDTIAQVRAMYKKEDEAVKKNGSSIKEELQSLFVNHDWLRAARMTSYGFLFYGPGSYAWYQCLDHFLPKQSVQNLLTKVFLNQVILGPCVIAVVFAWNNLWQGKLAELPMKYQKDALPTLLLGFRFWIPVSALNFWIVPLQARVAFMSLGSIFWNFCLSSTMSK